MTVNGKYYSDPEAAAYIKELEEKVKRMTELLKKAVKDFEILGGKNHGCTMTIDCSQCPLNNTEETGMCGTWRYLEEVKRLIEEQEQPKRCEHYTAGHWFLGDSYGTCHGTREQDPCSCEGDRNRCDYYKEEG